MKKYFLMGAALMLILTTGCAQESDFEASVRAFQNEKNEMFADPEKSPLTEEERTEFEELPFYEINDQFRVSARFEKNLGKVIEMPTTTDRLARYRPYGQLYFDLAGDTLQLTLFERIVMPMEAKAEPEPLFLPFTDLTNGDETYGGGRYIDLERQPGTEWVLDFNRAYNPYCAYNKKYSCPIPPAENHLDYRIEAGVKYGGY